MSRRRAVVSWSSGKDAAWALHLARQRDDLEVTGLLAAVNAEFQRVSMHGVRRELLEQQALAAALPLLLVVSALSSLLFYWRVLPPIVRGMAWLLERTLGVGGAVGLVGLDGSAARRVSRIAPPTIGQNRVIGWSSSSTCTT